ncbi:MAG: cytochrome P450 [Pseudomonadota bacterium]|nr:cytochrome P450 [Pseudomonadota bacterium]
MTTQSQPVHSATMPSLDDIDAFSPDILQDPYRYFSRLRNEAPVFRDPKTGIVYVSNHELVKQVCLQPQIFSNRFRERMAAGGAVSVDPDEAALLEQTVQVTDTMLTADPPDHTRYKKLSMMAFTFKRVNAMAGYIAEITNMLIDRLPKGGCEFKSAFANHLPMIVIADALGVPREDMERFHRWSDAFIVQFGGVSDKPTRLDAIRKIIEFQKYFIERIEERRSDPRDDIVSDLVHANLANEGDPRRMEYPELLSILQALLVAGNETTAHSLTAGIYYLLSHPDQMARLLADPSRYPNFIEETLRFLTPVNNMWRVAVVDANVGGVDIRKGDLMLLRFGSANRDERVFEHGEEFDITRPNANKHLAFGTGIHTCLGAQLARKEMNIAFPILLQRLKNPRLSKDVNSFRYNPNILLRGVLELHIAYDLV